MFVVFPNDILEIDDTRLIVWAETWGIDGDLRKKYALHRLIYADTFLCRSVLRGEDFHQSSLWQIALKEVDSLRKFTQNNSGSFLENYVPIKERSRWKQREKDLFQSYLHDDATAFLEHLVGFYQRRGFGDFAFFPFFRWDQGLHPIQQPDLVKIQSLIGYEDQKQQICRNTEAFLAGAKGNHVLLYGQRGTGKSSTIKAVGTRYYPKGLRLIELDRHRLQELPALCRTLEDIALKFIIYIDDLSFEESETDYKSLKAALEGSLEKPRDNILIYATSNRRHLVRETWSQRKDEDVHIRETQDEILSLSHRFGLAISFFNPKQEEFLGMVEQIAKQRNIAIPREALRRDALVWTRWQQGISGRTAVQFINEVEIRIKEQEKENHAK